MKSLSKYLALLAAVAGLVTVTARAEDEKPAPKHERGGDKDRAPKLTKEEREKIKAAMDTAEKDPAVIKLKADLEAARAKAKESKTPEDRKAAMEAGKALREAVKAAAIKADPSIAELIKKLPERGEGRGEGRPERGPKPGKGGDKPADAPKPPAPPAGE